MRRDRSPHICAGLPAVLAAVALTLASCSTSNVPQIEGSVVSHTCTGAALCVTDAAVYACQGGEIGGLLDDCSAKGQVCSLARCTSLNCQSAETNTNSLIGCLFYTVEAENVDTEQTAATSFLVTNPGDDPAAVEIQLPFSSGPGGVTQWPSTASVQVASGASGRLVPGAGVVVPRGVGTTPAAAIRISSDRPVTVIEIESDDANESATSTGGTMVLPLQSLGIDYRAVTYPQAGTQAVAETPGSRGGAGRVIIVGTQSATAINLSPVGPVTAPLGGGVDALGAGDDFPIALNDGDVFQIYTGADGEDLTGSRVTSNRPIAVFSGNIATTYGSEVTGINSPDMAHEQMPPIVTWSETYVAAALTPQASVGCTSFFGNAGASIWRVLASTNGTTVSFEGPAAATLNLLPPNGVAEPLSGPLTLDAGGAASLIGAGSFTVIASSPVLVTQGLDCEASLSLAIAADAGALIKNLSFALLPNFDQLLAIVRPMGATVDLDDKPLPDSVFQPAGAALEVGEVSLAACPPAAGVCTHHLTAARGFGLTMRGMDVQSSYALTAPALVGCDPAYEVCLN
jgi:IgGFc binding protein